QAVLAVLTDPVNANDRWIPDAATCAAAANSEHFLRALSARKDPPAKLLAITPIVAEHYARGGPADSVGGLLARLAGADPKVADAVVYGLARGWPGAKPAQLDGRVERELERLLSRLSPARRGSLIQLAATWGSKKFEKYAAEVSGSLLAQVKDGSLGAAERIAAAREFARNRGADNQAVRALLDLVPPQTPPELAAGILGALEVSEAPQAGQILLDRLPGFTPSLRAAGLRVLLTRPAWTEALLDRADKGEVRLADLSLDQQQALAAHPDKVLRKRAKELLKRGG